MKGSFFLFFLFVCFCIQGNTKEVRDSIWEVSLYSSESGAEDPLVPQVIPLSPQSAVYQKYLNHKINECTGIPDIRVPLYELEVRGLKIPIVLSYHASGIKAHQYDGDVGAGWSLNVGGFKVMRSVYGGEDERVDRYSYTTWESNYANLDGYTSTAQQRMDKDTYLSRFVLGAQDGEHDHFSYILPSSSGHFILQNSTRAGQVRALIAENNRDRISFSGGDGTYSFRNITVTDGEGFIYEMSVDNKEYASDNNTVIGWPLSKILTPYNEEVKFEYSKYATMYNEGWATHFSYTEAPFYTNWIPYDNVSPDDGELTGDRFSFPYSFTDYQTSSLLVQKIDAPNCKIVFLRKGMPYPSGSNTEQRYQWNQLVSDIEIYNMSDELIKKVHFDYELVTKGGINRHNLLKALVISGQQPSSEEKYAFSYYPPLSNSITNEWGYGGAGTWIHELFRTYPQLLYKKRISGIDEYTQFEKVVDSYYIKGFGNRSAGTNPTSSEYSLQKIVFPTGGFTEYEYESHEDDEGVKVGGLRIKRITSKIAEDSTPIITEYQYGEAKVEVHLSATDFAEEQYGLSFFEQVAGPGFGNIAYRGTRTLIFSTTPIQEELWGSSVRYGKVSILQYDQGQNKYNGKTVMRFGHIPFNERKSIAQRAYITPFVGDCSINLTMPNNTFGRGFWVGSYLGYEPVLTNRIYYDQYGTIKKEENYVYSGVDKEVSKELKVKNKIKVTISGNFNPINVYRFVSTCYDYIEYDLHMGFYRLDAKNVIDYTDSGIVTFNESYSYNQNNQLKEKTTYPIVEQYNYPEDFTDAIYSSMVTANILSPIIEKIKYNLSFSRNEIGRMKTNYSSFGNMYLPSSKQSKIYGDYRTDIFYDLYDMQGNIRQYTTLDGTSTVLLWAYKGQYPIAEIKNTTYSHVLGIVNESALNAISSRIAPTDSDWVLINNLRSDPAMSNASVTTYTYKPLIGILTITDPTGLTVYYEYDSLGRLLRVKNDSGKVIEEYEYYYAE
jgi:hypothetical protein